MKQDIGGLGGRPSGVKVLQVRVLDDDLSAGGRVSYLGFQGNKELALRQGPIKRQGRVSATHSTFALGPLFGSSDGILLVGVHLIHHLLFLKLTLRLFFSSSLVLVRRLGICGLAFPLVALSRGLLRGLISVDSGVVSVHGLTVVLSSSVLFGLSVLSSSYSFQLLGILGSFLLVSGLFLSVGLDRWRRVVVSISLPVYPRRRGCHMGAVFS